MQILFHWLILGARMKPDSLTDRQIDVASSGARFRVLASGRRFGKTFLCVYELMRAASKINQVVWYIAPTYRQAKQIAWKMLKDSVVSKNWKCKVNESDLSVLLLQSNSTIALRGADKPDSLRGVGINFLAIDEAADVKKEAWFEVLRPTLSDTGGEAIFLGTPKGRNWFHDLYQRGKTEDNWMSWQFTTIDGGNVPESEIEAARSDLDELTFNQEYLASFVDFAGRAYYPFTVELHVANKLKYNAKQRLILCFDFNVEPGICVVIQEQQLPNGLYGSGIIDEVYIPRNSNTPAVCRKITNDYSKHEGQVFCYGDATGGARGSAKVSGSDWDLIRQVLNPVFKDRLSFRVAPGNPPERTRVNAVNSRLKSSLGDVKLMVDKKCKYTIRDFEGVQLLQGGSGEIDKKANLELTHITDAIGYYINCEFPVVNRVTTVSGTGVN